MARTRLRRVDCSGPGISRRRYGKGFAYFDDEGRRIDDDEVLARIRELAIPPAWEDVWICPYPHGHLQATGTDVAGRKQYRYHDAWRARRDAEKFDDMVRFARALPALRRRVEEDLADCAIPTRSCVLACAVRLLERGFFRIGSEEYAVQNESYGLATMRKDHVRIEPGGQMVFSYPAKSGVQRLQGLMDEQACTVVAALKRRRGGSEELLAYKEGGRWRDVRSEDVNAYLKAATGGDFSAKDFRTWNATLLAAVALGVAGEVAATKTGRKRAINRAIKEVAGYLGNTPAVCRASYIDPRVFDAYQAGLTIRPTIERVAGRMEPGDLLIHQPELESAVLDLLSEDEDSAALERVAA
ncbi:MAG TPA: DNA topoisomerase IB [Solirubrobacteraceae bacterium]|nr:DNA topoisomerase IB [Solirubrobacteraceae bacterium]